MTRKMNSFLFGLSSATIIFVMLMANTKDQPSLFTSKTPEHGHWTAYKTLMSLKFNEEEEELMRSSLFKAHVDFITSHNSQSNSYTVALNRFSHLTQEEFKKVMLSAKSPGQKQNPTFQALAGPVLRKVDWRSKGYVSHVKNQGQCGSCYSFGATGAMESSFFNVHGKKYLFSEQDFVDCSSSYGNNGCNGGWMDSCFAYGKDHGLVTEDSYPYEAKEGTCRRDNATVVAYVKSWFDIPQGNEKALVHALSISGPVSVAIDAGKISFQFYRSGVYDDPKCDHVSINHAVLAVGYTEDAYIVKNSWGEDWGDKGYISMIRNKDICGISSHASYPVMR